VAEKEAESKMFAQGDSAVESVPLKSRVHWMSPATIYAGCEFCIPVIMVGAGLAASFSMAEICLILLFGLVVVTWIGDFLCSYLGAMTGRPSSVIGRASFGHLQARIVIALSVLIIAGGWWALQTAVAGNAISAMLGIDYTTQWWPWAIITIVCGLIFAVPSIIGYSSMAWTDYLAVPGGILILVWAFFLSLRATGWAGIWAWNPPQTTSWAAAISGVIGLNVAQWVMLSDYSRYCHPRLYDAFMVPSGVVVVGFVLFIMGGIMSVGIGTSDIVQVMQGLGFPAWAFLILFLAQWTSQLVNNYSMGLAMCNMFNVTHNRGRAYLTFAATVLGIIVALAGILNQFMNFLYLTALAYPPIASVMVVDYWLIRDKGWKDIPGWNWMATLTIAVGTFLGYYTQYMHPWGVPAIQTYIVSGALYYGVMYAKAQIAPDAFTPDKWMRATTGATAQKG